jgi:hypothetical protein
MASLARRQMQVIASAAAQKVRFTKRCPRRKFALRSAARAESSLYEAPPAEKVRFTKEFWSS